MMTNQITCKVSFFLPFQEYEGAGETFLFQHTSWGWEEEEGSDGVRCSVYFSELAQARAFIRELQNVWPALEVEESGMENTDWASAWKEFFTPIRVGDFFEIRPSWLEGESELEPLIIEPKMAFGTGHHATTFLCLRAICDLRKTGKLRAGQRFCDLGTGSGILSIACARLGLTGIGVDIDPVAIDNARENCGLNNVAGAVELRLGSVAEVAEGERFDLLVANILSGPLILMAEDIMSHLRPGGLLVLSGLLVEQAAQVQQAYAALGTPRKLDMDEWCALLWDCKG